MGRSFHPQAWLVWGAAGLTVALLTRNPLYLLLVLLAARLTGLAAVLPRDTPGLLRLILPILGLTTFWNLATVHMGETVLIVLPRRLPLVGGPLTLEAALWGLTNGLALAALLTLFLTLNSAVSSHELARLAPPFLHEAGLVASIALTFVPQTLRALREIRDAQAVRGHRVRGPRDSLPLLLPLLITGLEKAVQLAEAMEARGYGAGDPPPLRDRLLVAAGLLGMLAGWFAALFWWQQPLAGYLIAGTGMILEGWGLWRMGRLRRHTRYRPRRWSLADGLMATAAAVPLVLTLGCAVTRPELLAYTPYPRVTLPPFEPLVGGGLIMLVAPTLILSSKFEVRGSKFEVQSSEFGVRGSGQPPGQPVLFHRVTFTYPGAFSPVLRDLSLEIPPGSFVLVTGPSGVGKSTLLRCINGLVPHTSGGRFGGRVVVGGRDTRTTGPRQLAQRVGFVFQDPEAQFVTDRVEEEVAFALENAGVGPARMQARVEEVLERLGLASLRGRAINTLSGGEMQRVAVAAALALAPSVLVLDEPTSQLDPEGARQVLDLLARLQRELGITVVLAEHRLERVLRYADLVVYLSDAGSPPRVGPPREVLREVPLVPPVVALGRALGWEPLPVTVEEGRSFVADSGVRIADSKRRPLGLEPPILRVEGLSFAYNGAEVLREVDLRVRVGELVVLMGPNGAGKTTLLKCIVGLLRPRAGSVWLGGEEVTGADPATVCRRVGYLPQDPGALLFAESVAEEMRVTLSNHGLAGSPPIPPGELLDRLGLGGLAGAYPRDLSVGERGRVALGAIAVTRPAVLLLDEPTRGLDYRAKEELVWLLRRWQAEGTGVLMVTHDVELVARAADRVVRLEGGRIVDEGTAHQVLSGDDHFAPQMARLFPGAGWLTVEEALAGLARRAEVTPSLSP
ncbi:MAG TPA: ATP-binding cassette domain-containing protein, partial [Anaerolineales bacterium]|nr:ATP-binding cassette domain-containing protein [Anaerolineales bacterium]